MYVEWDGTIAFILASAGLPCIYLDAVGVGDGVGAMFIFMLVSAAVIFLMCADASATMDVEAWLQSGVATGHAPRKRRVAGWRAGGLAGWRAGGLANWRGSGLAGWRAGGLAGWRAG